MGEMSNEVCWQASDHHFIQLTQAGIRGLLCVKCNTRHVLGFAEKTNPESMPGSKYMHYLRDLRIQRHISQKRMAEMVGLSVDQIRDFERLKVAPEMRHVRKIAKAMKVKLST